MGKPYSLDLRKRVVAAIEGGMSRNQAAKQFGVAISTAIENSAKCSAFQSGNAPSSATPSNMKVMNHPPMWVGMK